MRNLRELKLKELRILKEGNKKELSFKSPPLAMNSLTLSKNFTIDFQENFQENFTFQKITMYINMIFVLKNNTKQSRDFYLSYPLLMRGL